jgi:hypothetical protein
VWTAKLWQHLEPIHRMCEAERLHDASLDWTHYADPALSGEVWADAGSLRAWAKKALNVLRSSSYPGHGSAMARWGFRVLARKQWFPLIYPVVAYDVQDTQLRELAARMLGCRSTTIAELRRAYLRLWSEVGDPGFGYIVRQWPALLEPGDAAS